MPRRFEGVVTLDCPATGRDLIVVEACFGDGRIVISTVKGELDLEFAPGATFGRPPTIGPGDYVRALTLSPDEYRHGQWVRSFKLYTVPAGQNARRLAAQVDFKTPQRLPDDAHLFDMHWRGEPPHAKTRKKIT